MRNGALSSVVVCALALVTFCPALAQQTSAGWPPASGDLRFAAESAGIPEAGGGGRVEITYEVAHDELIFIRHGEGYRARFEVTAILYGSGGRQVAGDSWVRTVTVATYAETNSRTASERETLSLSVEPGSYSLKVEIRSLDTRSVGRVERRIEVPGLAGSGLTLGTVTFQRQEGPGEERRFAPSPSRTFGVDHTVARVRIPVYGSEGSVYTLSLSVGPEGGVQTPSFSDTVTQTAWLTEHYHDIHVDALEVGSYLVKIKLSPADSEKESTARALFRVLTSPRSWGEDFDKMIAQIGYVASRSEVDRILDADPEDREAAWQEFWDGRDPTPGTEENEFRMEFLDRLGYVNAQFSSLVEGWQTDMGRVYIQNGPPDDLESQPIGASLNAWEVWYYYGQHTKYIFVDRDGFGEFKLVETTRI